MNVSDQAQIKSNTGNATVVQMGHTDNGHFGSDTSAKTSYNRQPKDLHVNAKG